MGMGTAAPPWDGLGPRVEQIDPAPPEDQGRPRGISTLVGTVARAWDGNGWKWVSLAPDGNG